MKKPLIIIAGPTASGKTKLSVALAQKINGEIISADSMQVYKGMDIGTAKVKEEEMGGIKHHLISILDPGDGFNIHSFQKLAKNAIQEIESRGKIPILVGGTGFYIQSVLYNISFDESESNLEIRKNLEKCLEEKGNLFLHSLLKDIDTPSYENIHPNNVKRVIRALEYYQVMGRPISEHNEEERNKQSPYDFLFYVLTMNRDLLYERINQRVEEMFEQGLLDEVKELVKKGYTKELVSMQGLGYKEIIDYFEGKYSLEEAKYILKRDTRHFAKRQLTWFRREKDAIWLPIDQFHFNNENILSKMIKDIEEIRNL